MKLSSTIKTGPYQPCSYIASNSLVICLGVLVRDSLPKSFVISQKSQSNGQPREYCIAKAQYLSNFNKSHLGIGVLVKSGFPFLDS